MAASSNPPIPLPARRGSCDVDRVVRIVPETVDPAFLPADVVQERCEVYTALLGSLDIVEPHFKNLVGRGLSADEIYRRQYKSSHPSKLRAAVQKLIADFEHEKLLRVPGFQGAKSRLAFVADAGLLIPIRDANGRIIALKVRHDDGVSQPKYRRLTTEREELPVHIPLGVPGGASQVRVTEGELRADVAFVLSGLPTIAVPGGSNWHLAIPVLRALNTTTVRLALDQDGKPGTLSATFDALIGLHREGFDVALEWWDPAAGKGIDDLLAKKIEPELLKNLSSAVRVLDAVKQIKQPETVVDSGPEPFPLDVLPPAYARYCREVSSATATPPDYAAVALLVVAGAAIGGSRALCVKDHTWHERPAIYAMCVGDPASGKTPALETVVRPYKALQLRLLSGTAERLKPTRARRGAKRSHDGDCAGERFLAADATVESLAPILTENPRGLLILHDEGAAWVTGMGQYKGGKGNDRQFWLSAWSGATQMVDRKSRGGTTVSVARPFLSVLSGIQPDMLGELSDHRGRHDGFLNRILFVYPTVSVGAEWNEFTVSEVAEEQWSKTLSRLQRLAMQTHDDGMPGYKSVRFSQAAKDEWVKWWNFHAEEMRSEDLSTGLLGAWVKLRSYAARLILILHYLRGIAEELDDADLDADVQPESVNSGVRLIDYFKGHLRLVYARLRESPEDLHLQSLLDWIRRQGGTVSAREVVRAKKVTPTAKARAFLHELEARGHGRIEHRQASNGKIVDRFVIDPGSVEALSSP